MFQPENNILFKKIYLLRISIIFITAFQQYTQVEINSWTFSIF